MNDQPAGFFSNFFDPSRSRLGARALKPNREGPVKAEEALNSEMLEACKENHDLGALITPCQITGKSGVRHNFTFGFGPPQGINVVGDVVVGTGPVDETKVLSLFIKVYDVNARHAVLCVVPSLTAEAKKLSSLYKIVLVESADKRRLSAMMSETLQRLSKGR